MDPQQFAGNGCFGSSDRILQRRRGQSREPAQSSAASQVPRPPSEPAVCTEYCIYCCAFVQNPATPIIHSCRHHRHLHGSAQSVFNRLWRAVLLRTTKLAQSTSQYYFVLQSLQKVLPSTTSYYKPCTKYFPVLLRITKLAQSTSQYYFVLQSLHKALPSTTSYYKACTKYFPVLLRTTKLAQSTSNDLTSRYDSGGALGERFLERFFQWPLKW